MYEEAIVEIYGRLATGIMIGRLPDGRQYGKTIISVSKISPAYSSGYQETCQTTYLPVFIWNQELLEKEGSLLKKGLRVLLTGELELLDRSFSLTHDRIDNCLQDNTVVISMNRNRGITIISQVL